MPLEILFVCYENICRSPMAEGIFSALLLQHDLHHCFSVSSAGTVALQHGSSPDGRAIRALSLHGIDISEVRARCVEDIDLDSCDWIFVMDRENYEEISRYLSPTGMARVHMILDMVEGRVGEEIADPWYDGPEAFERVAQELFQASEELLAMMFRLYPYLAEEPNRSN